MRDDASNFTAPTLLESIWRALAWPHKLFNVLFVIAFIVFMAELFTFSHFNPGVIVFFGLPPLFALGARNSTSSLPSTRFLGSLFLILISFGDVFTLVAIHLGLHGSARLPTSIGLMDEWYGGVFVAFVIFILPPFLFIRPIMQRRRGEVPYFSMFTCCLGLLLWCLLVTIFGSMAWEYLLA